MPFNRYFSGSLNSKTWYDRVLAACVLLLLTLQLLSSGQHKGDHIGVQDDCVSCFFAHHLPTSLPNVAPVPVPVLALALYPLIQFVQHDFDVRISFLIPRAQAPPRAASLTA
jgi:hypothetical protein